MTQDEYVAWCAEVNLCTEAEALKGISAKIKEIRCGESLMDDYIYYDQLTTKINNRLMNIALRDGVQDFHDFARTGVMKL